jgi:hypothetical protein
MEDFEDLEFYSNDLESRLQANKQLQKLINSGDVWKFEGSYGRAASQALGNGECVLGKKGVRDYYGNYVPSRYEVKAGTKGSVALARANWGDRYARSISRVS